MAHLSLGFFHLSPTPNTRNASLSRPPPSISLSSWRTQPPPAPTSSSSSSSSSGNTNLPPLLPFHLFSPCAHQWFFSAAPPRSVAGEGVVAAVESVEERKGSRLIAQNIPWTYTCEDVRVLFENHGTVLDVELSMHNSTRNRGLAFIDMGSEEEAEEALNSLNLYEVDGRVIKVEYARSVKKKHSAPASPAPRYNVFAGNLTYSVRSRNLRELFTAFNPNVLHVEVIYQSNPRRPAGYGFASFASKEEADAAIAALSGKKLMGRNIKLVLGKKVVEGSEVQMNEGEPLMDEKQHAYMLQS